MMGKRRIIVGVTGASGVVMARKLLTFLSGEPGIETHLVATQSARLTWQCEVGTPFEELENCAHLVYDEGNLAAAISSGSYETEGMIIIPCSMKTLSGIAHGYADNLLQRAADVCLKENRKLVLVPREMPLGKVHLQNLMAVANLGCIIVPPMLTFYNGSQSIEEQINHVAGKVLMQFGIRCSSFRPWEGI